MAEDAADVWRLAVDEMGITKLSGIDTELLRGWCQTVAELRASESWVAENGTTFILRDDKGNVRGANEAPRYKQVRALRADLLKMQPAMESLRRRSRRVSED